MPQTILIVDDEKRLVSLVESYLIQEGYHVATAFNGKEALAVAAKEKPDLIILDIMMPDMDGMQVCDAVRKFSPVPILILSALDTPGTIAAALNAGADDYLVKPVACNMLLARIEQLIRRSHQEAGLINHHVVV